MKNVAIVYCGDRNSTSAVLKKKNEKKKEQFVAQNFADLSHLIY